MNAKHTPGPLTGEDEAVLRKAFVHSGGRAWEPANPAHSFFDRAIHAGYLRRVDGRFGFERFKDSMVDWTDAGRAAIAKATGAA